MARYTIPFFTVTSPAVDKPVNRWSIGVDWGVSSPDYPITKIIEEQSIRDIQAIEDSAFLEAMLDVHYDGDAFTAALPADTYIF